MTQPETARVERGPITEVPHFALGMAALLERQGFTIAAELRRLSAVEAQRDALLEALKEAVDICGWPNVAFFHKALAAIKAVEENT